MKDSTDIPRALLFRGEDDFRKEQEAEAFVKSVVSEDFADFDLERLDGDSVTCSRVVSGLSVAPIGSARRVLVVKHAHKIPKEEQEELAKKLASLPASSCLVLVNPAPEKVDGRPKKGTEIISDLAAAVRKVGAVRDFGGGKRAEKEADARKLAQNLFNAAGKKADNQALTALIRRVGTDLQILASESEKLIAYAGQSDRITASDVDTVTAETPEEKVFKLIDAVGAKNKPLALRLLGGLFEDASDADSAAPRTLSLIAKQFRLIWQMKMLQSAGIRDMKKSSIPKDIVKRLPKEPNLLDIISRQPWQQEKIARQAAGFSRQDLSRCLLAVARADRMLKGLEGSVDNAEAVMELLVIELAS